ncbi:RNA-directed DNA polymerase, eukaryota [Tanacetum coccineum]
MRKSNVYGVGVSEEEVSSMATNAGCSPRFFPFMYLGLPIGSTMNLSANWKYLLDRFQSRLSKWKANLLSIGGHLTLLKSSTHWDKVLPRKVNIFIWRLKLDRLPHRLNLSSRGIEIPELYCSSCSGNVESNLHIIFECDIAKNIWRLIQAWCDNSIPTFASMDH